MALVQIKNIEFKYDSMALPTLGINDFKIEPGERIFLFGPSGSGKTTLLEILAGVLIPQKGSVLFLDKDFTTLNSSQRDQMRAAHIGYIFQQFNLIPYLSVQENILLPLYLSTEKRKNVAPEKELQIIQDLCHRLGIKDLLPKSVKELSVGQQQRVAVARALLGKPSLILADEPTSALDQDHRARFLELLFEVCREHKIAILFVSHDRTLQSLFDRSISLLEINQTPRLL